MAKCGECRFFNGKICNVNNANRYPTTLACSDFADNSGSTEKYCKNCRFYSLIRENDNLSTKLIESKCKINNANRSPSTHGCADFAPFRAVIQNEIPIKEEKRETQIKQVVEKQSANNEHSQQAKSDYHKKLEEEKQRRTEERDERRRIEDEERERKLADTEWLKTDEGKEWLIQEEKIEKTMTEMRKRTAEDDLRREEEEKRLAEEQRIENEKLEKINREKRHIQLLYKMPIFILSIVITLFYKNTMDALLNLVYGKMLISLIAIIVVLVIYYKLSSSILNAAYSFLAENKETTHKRTKFNDFIYYFVISLIPTAIYGIIMFLVMHFLIKIW